MSKKHFVQKSQVSETWVDTLVVVTPQPKNVAPKVVSTKPSFRRPFMEVIPNEKVRQFLEDKTAKDGPSCFNAIVCCNTPIGVLATIEAFKLRRMGVETEANASKLPGGGLKTIAEEIEALQNLRMKMVSDHIEDKAYFAGEGAYDSSFFQARIKAIDEMIEELSCENCDVVNFLKIGAAREFSEEMGGKFLSASFFTDEIAMRVFTRYVNGAERVFVVFVTTHMPKIFAFDAEHEQMVSRDVLTADFKSDCETVRRTSCDQILGSMVLSREESLDMREGFVNNCGWVASHAFITNQLFGE